MKNVSKVLLIAIMLCAGVAFADPAPSPAPVQLAWPPLEGFKHETMPFPLDFAKGIHYNGFEELRFAPGFGTAGAPDYFTYSFIWVLADPAKVDAESLKTDLREYFDGLMATEGKEKNRPANHYRTHVQVTPTATGFAATIHTWDAFVTGGPLHLSAHISQLPTSVAGYKMYYFEVSPNIDSDQIKELFFQVKGQYKGTN